MQQISMAPFLLKRFIEDCWTVRGVCDFYVIAYLVAMFLYVLVPYDIIPESVYGVLGIIDDIFIVLLFLVPITRGIFTAYARVNSVGAQQQENQELQSV